MREVYYNHPQTKGKARAILSSLDFADKILVFSDGACSGNPGPGGLGIIIAYPDGNVLELGEGHKDTTNNRMEMLGALRSLQKLKGVKGDVWFLTDSTYVIRGITQWIWGWRKRGWKTAEGKDVANKDLWQILEREVTARKGMGQISWKYVRGHKGIPGNERCDEIAVGFSQGKWVDLYEGSLLEYSVAIHDLPEDMSVPEMKSRNEKKKAAHSYLSYAGGKLQRHGSWKECEAVVKGRSGAKFKKAQSASDERQIVESWGLNPDHLDESN